jgi:chromosomal replication initiation ATPase DnaA
MTTPIIQNFRATKEVMDYIKQETGLDLDTLRSKTRKWAISSTRQIGYYLLYKHGAFTYSEVGELFDRNSETVAYGVAVIDSIISIDSSHYRDKYVKEVVSKFNQEMAVA